jgi:capsular polysaccharide export protein
MNYFINKIENRKIKKLIRDPKQYFSDSKMAKPFIEFFNKRGNSVNNVIVGDLIGDEEIINNRQEISPINIPGLELFDLVGDNWLNHSSEKPIAILFGFNLWKRKFISSYLKEYRTAFARGKSPWSSQVSIIDSLDDVHFIVWGYTEPELLISYANQREIPVSRMEDGFLRSADLGSQHSTPLSLVIDHSGLYYDATRPSDLENLLNEHDFSSNKELMELVKPLISLFCKLRVSKYNLGSFRSAAGILGMKFKRRVLVIGQVEQDASIFYGLGQEWTCQKLIELAKAENPNSEIIYKPHPDVIQGFRKNSVELRELQKICRVVMSPVVLSDLFGVVDHVYTITSLSGCEALLHGLPVTVVGAPFYAGWGLTDDRQILPRRIRRLSLEELFCGAYLLYPKYLTDFDNQLNGCLAAILRMTAQRKILLNNMLAVNVEASLKIVENNSNWLAASDYWLTLLNPKFFQIIEKKYDKNLLQTISVRKIFATSYGDYYQRSVAYLLAGKLRGSKVFGVLLNELRTNIKPEHFSALLIDLWEIQPSTVLMEQWALHCEKSGDFNLALEAFNHLSYTKVFPKGGGALPIPVNKCGFILKLAHYELRQRNFDKAAQLFNHLLLSNYLEGSVISGLAEIARLRFDFSSAAALLRLFNHYNPTWNAGRGYLLQAQSEALEQKIPEAIEGIAIACFINPQLIGSLAEDTGIDFSKIFRGLPVADALLSAVMVGKDSGPIARAKGLINHERSAHAEKILIEYMPTSAEMEQYCLTLSQAYSFQDKLKDASQLIQNRLEHTPTLLIYREALRLAVLADDHVWIKNLLSEIRARDIEVGEVYLRKAAAALGDIKGYHSCFRKMASSKTLKAYLGDRYVQTMTLMPRTLGATCLFLTYFGPGDEVRWASLYPKMRSFCGEAEVTFTCDKRLLPLLKRSFEDLKFIEVGRNRYLNSHENYKNIEEIPGSDLFRYIDNSGWDIVKNSDKVILQLDALGDLIHDYESYDGSAYLKADPNHVAVWRERLSLLSDKPLVGLNWRSSIQTFSRNHNYLSVEDLIPFFQSIDNVNFINLQYDECSSELAYINDLFPGKIINFPDLDQYNDLDGVAALMSCMDLIIAPATIAVEMAGALGVPTLFITNSTEANWRQRPGQSIDFWHNSVTHIKGSTPRDKSSLVESLICATQKFLSKLI